MALTSITMASGVTVNGRALARNGKVTLKNDKITNSCSTGTGASPGASQLPDAAMSGGDAPVAPWSPFVVIGAVAVVLTLMLIVVNVRRSALGKEL